MTMQSKHTAPTPTRRETMLPQLLGELRTRRRRRRAQRAVASVATLALIGALIANASGLLSTPKPTAPAQHANAEAPTPQLSGHTPTAAAPVAAPRDIKRGPLIAIVGTAPGLAEKWSTIEPTVFATRVSDEQLLAALNEEGPRFGLVRVDGVATLVPRRVP